MAKLDWQKAREREAARNFGAAGKPRPETNAKRQAALAEFVRKHELRCFKCGGEKAEWAKTGISKRRAWAICTQCVTAVATTRPQTPAAQHSVAERTVGAMPPIVYTDGACSPNPGRGGYAAVILGVLARGPLVVSGAEPHTTNNRMEMRAVIEGLNALDPSPAVDVVTDSVYVLKGYTEWLPGWIQRGWRTSAKKPIQNADLWAKMVVAAERHGRVTWQWVRGHTGDEFNEMAHRVAVERALAD